MQSFSGQLMVFEFLMVIFFSFYVFFFVTGEKLVQVLSSYFILFSVLVLLMFKKFVLIVFL